MSINIRGPLRKAYVGDQPLVSPDDLGIQVDGDDLVIAHGHSSAVRFRGAAQPVVFVRRAALSADDVITAAEFIGAFAVESMTDVIDVPAANADRYLAFWQGADQLELTIIRRQANEINLRGSFESPLPVTVNSVDGYYWRSSDVIPSGRLGQNWTLNTDGADFPPFPRRIAAKLPADPDNPNATQTWIGSDFLHATDSQISYTRHVKATTWVESSPEAEYHTAYWVPDAYPDILDVLSVDALGEVSGFGGGFTGFSSSWGRQPGTVEVDGVVGKVWGSLVTRRPFNPDTLVNAYRLIIQEPSA